MKQTDGDVICYHCGHIIYQGAMVHTDDLGDYILCPRYQCGQSQDYDGVYFMGDPDGFREEG
jgi:hypothetical protein